MGFTSIDDWINEVTVNSKFYRADWMKQFLATGVAGAWFDCDFSPGNPPAMYNFGDLTTNGNFSGSAWGWTLTSGWAWSADTILKNGDGTTTLSQATCIPVIGKTYRVTYTLTVWTVGTCTVSMGGQTGTARGSAATFEEIFTCTTAAPLAFTPTNTARFTIDNVTVTEILTAHGMSELDFGGLYHGGDTPAGESKHILNAGVVSAAANFHPGVWMLVDKLMCYPSINMNINTLQTLLHERLINGSFTGNANNWTVGANWTYNANAVDRAAADVTELTQIIGCEKYRRYKVVFTITSWTAGTVTARVGGTLGTARGSAATFTEYIIAGSTDNLLSFVPSADAVLTIDTVSCTECLPRYVDGKGVRAYLVSTFVPGAVAHNIAMTYINTAGAESVLPLTVAATVSCPASRINHSGVAASNYGPFLPLASGDQGILSVKDFQLSAIPNLANGYAAIVLCKPLLTLPCTTVSICSERDLMNQLPSLPRVYDGACLTWLFFPGAATVAASNVMGYLDFCWG
jgi:hypothetical protein